MKRALLSDEELQLAAMIRQLALVNPFLPERLELERRVLGPAFQGSAVVWSAETDRLGANPNEAAIGRRIEGLVAELRSRLESGREGSEEELELYQDLVLYMLYYRLESRFYDMIVSDDPDPESSTRAEFFVVFAEEARSLLARLGPSAISSERLAHRFALLFQIRRAFHFIFRNIFGSSMAAARLRAAVWQSVFTHDMRRYRRSLHGRMHQLSTLITGPSGTGKELVASAIGYSRYLSFDVSSLCFTASFRETFIPLNLSALPASLIESELFGHRKGSFTGAVRDRAGYLEGRGASHSVFLDEIGDLDASIQVKLLRLLETRAFHRVGETRAREFGGKIIAATNRDLGAEIGAGRFREDLYYRLCSDLVVTPSLAEQLAESPDELRGLIRLLARRVVDPEDAESLTDEVVTWIEGSLGPSYAWPGNVRELEQCVRNILVRGSYRPSSIRSQQGAVLDQVMQSIAGGRLSAEEVLSRYCTLVYAMTSRYQVAGRTLGLDRRTVKRRIDPELLERLRRELRGSRGRVVANGDE